MSYYYYRDTSGPDTNLQVYALRKAKSEWRELEEDVAEKGEENVPDLKERCVFALATLGLSISQLLGQNNPAPRDTWVPPPEQLWQTFVKMHNLDADLITQFKTLVTYYDGLRHFGTTTSGRGYDAVDALTFSVARTQFEFGLRVWAEVIAVFRTEPSAELDELDIDTIEDP